MSRFDASGANVTRLEILWHQELADPHRRRPPSLFRVVLRFFRTRLILSAVIFLFCLAFGFIGPVGNRNKQFANVFELQTCLVRALVAYNEEHERAQKSGEDIEQTGNTLKYGLMLVLSLFLVEMLRVLSYGCTWAISYRLVILECITSSAKVFS